jgi:predicted nucleotidyltransferase component of viral defense system
MTLDLTFLRRTALEKGLSLNYISKEDKLSNMLAQLSNFLDKNFILKGGTAINRIYLSEKKFNRFSEDIDIDYIFDKEKSEKINFCKKLMKNIQNFDIDKPRLMNNTLRFDCFYINELDHKDKVQVEFNLELKKYLFKPEKVLVKSSFIETNPCIFNTYIFENLIAMKFITLYDREEGKDIYDLYYSLKSKYEFDLLNKSLKKLIKYYEIKKDIFNFVIKKLVSFKEKYKIFQNSTNHYIPKSLRPDWKMLTQGLIFEIENIKDKFKK